MVETSKRSLEEKRSLRFTRQKTHLARSVEGVFHTLELPLFLLDLRAGEQEQTAWLAAPRDTRTVIGTIANHDQLSFSKRQLPREYDVLIFVDQMTPTDLLE